MDPAVVWALVIGLAVQGFVIYAAVRFALFHDRLMLTRQALEDEPADDPALLP